MFANRQHDRWIGHLGLTMIMILLMILAQGLQSSSVKANGLTVCSQGCDFISLTVAINDINVPEGVEPINWGRTTVKY